MENSKQPSRLAQSLRALRHRNFQLFFGGQLISLTGTWMQLIAQAWLVYRLTGSSLLLGSVAFASQSPMFFLATVGGTVADRHDRRRIIVATQIASMVLAFILAALTLTGTIRVWHIFVLASLLGVVNTFDMPARQAFLVDMVGKEDLLNAIALNSSLFNSTRILGPALAGLLVATIGEGWCFFGNGVSYIAAIIALLMMKTAFVKTPHEGTPLQHIIEGFRFAQKAGPIRRMLLLVGLINLVGMPYSVLMPIFADRILHGGARGLGILMASTGAGALAGALVLATRSGLHGLSRMIAFAAAGFGASLILFACSRWFWVSAVLLLPVGFSFMVQMASSSTLIQVMVPDSLRGRIMAFYSMMCVGMSPFGALFAGAIAQRLGAPLTVAMGGAACVVGGALFARGLPQLRVEARELLLAQQTADGETVGEVTGAAVLR